MALILIIKPFYNRLVLYQNSESKLIPAWSPRFITFPLWNVTIRLALLNNIEYQTLVIRLRAIKLAVITAKNEARWQLDLSAQHNHRSKCRLHIYSYNHYPSLGTITSGGKGPSFWFTLNISIDNVKAQKQIIDARIVLEQAKSFFRKAMGTAGSQYNKQN
ncbi:hypothetical protein [Candidatus Coxiella mudrowiae]|uniref:hypothetical protein n=1 Tax=Candidatus Coxiella mudrowiae TaxID=2054173 RepID=UPI001F2E6271|nr:hypothetical protein [Candidatus Coxiella mudrowiae]